MEVQHGCVSFYVWLNGMKGSPREQGCMFTEVQLCAKFRAVGETGPWPFHTTLDNLDN